MKQQITHHDGQLILKLPKECQEMLHFNEDEWVHVELDCKGRRLIITPVDHDGAVERAAEKGHLRMVTQAYIDSE